MQACNHPSIQPSIYLSIHPPILSFIMFMFSPIHSHTIYTLIHSTNYPTIHPAFYLSIHPHISPILPTHSPTQPAISNLKMNHTGSPVPLLLSQKRMRMSPLSANASLHPLPNAPFLLYIGMPDIKIYVLPSNTPS